MWVEVKPNKTKLLQDSEKIAMCIDYGNTEVSNSKGLLILGQIPYFDIRDKFNIPSFSILYYEEGICSNLADFVMGEKLTIISDRSCPYDVTSAPVFPELLSDENLNYLCCGVMFTDDNGVIWKLDQQSIGESAEKLRKCFSIARRARFEHGEMG